MALMATMVSWLLTRVLSDILTKNPGYGFPTTNCEAGLNARIHFPACWDGVVSLCLISIAANHWLI